jgi:hypothetical protein
MHLNSKAFSTRYIKHLLRSLDYFLYTTHLCFSKIPCGAFDLSTKVPFKMIYVWSEEFIP